MAREPEEGPRGTLNVTTGDKEEQLATRVHRKYNSQRVRNRMVQK